MNGEDSDQVVWTAAILRIIVVWWLCGWLVSLPARFIAWTSFAKVTPAPSPWGNQLPLLRIQTLVVTATAVLAVVVWHFSIPTARYIWRTLPAISRRPPLRLADLLVVAFTTLGLYLVISAIPALAQAAMTVHTFTSRQLQEFAPPNEFAAKAITALIRLFFGLFLFFNAASIARRAGEAGRTNETADETEPDA